MAEADEAVKQIYSWIELRELASKKLKKLAGELEDQRAGCTAARAASSTVATVGYAGLVAAGIATILTGGAAAPALALAGGIAGTTGTVVSLGATVLEHFLSSSTLKEAKETAEECNSKARLIQRLFERLKAQCPSSDPDLRDRYVLNRVMVAMGRRSGLPDFDPSDLLDRFNFGGHGGDPFMEDRSLVGTSAVVGVFGVMCFFAFQPSGKKMDLFLTKGSESLLKGFSSTGLKTALKGGAQVVGGAVGLIFSYSEAFDSWEALIKGNCVTEASESLRETAKSLLRDAETMKQKLNKLKACFERLKKVEQSIRNPQRTWEEKKMLMKFAIELCSNEQVKQWLRVNTASMALYDFVDRFYEMAKEMLEKYGKEREIDIVFVAHGSITEGLIPASCLLPTDRIKDVLLYSPWNCAIDSRVAYGIASGQIRPEHRQFQCGGKCFKPSSCHQPNRHTSDWNKMRNARGSPIPNIMVSPVGKPGDGAWASFMDLTNSFPFSNRTRVIVPHILPFTVPFFVVTLALSLILYVTKQKATVHLAACLSKRQGSTLNVDYLTSQYSYTIDQTIMTWSWDMFPTERQILYRLLKLVFK